MSHSLALTMLLALTFGQKPADPPYRKFKGLSFEPSAVVFNKQDDRIILYVLNDKDPLIYSFKLMPLNDKQEVTGIVDEAGKPIGVISLPLGDGRSNFLPQKFEALAPWPDGSFIAATAFDRPAMEYNQIVKFTVEPSTKTTPPSVRVVQAFVTTEVRKALANLPPASHGNIERSSFKIEGISPCSDGKKLLVGVRRYYNFRDGGEHDINEVILIARFGVERSGGLTYEGAVDLSLNEDCPCPPMGLSDLQRDEDGSYLVLASREDRVSRTVPPTIEGHAGALYRVSADVLEGKLNANAPAKGSLGKPLKKFIAKPEGVAVLPGKGRYLVVFDDDSDGWKALFQNYALHEGLYDIVTLSDGLEVPPK